MVQEKFRKTRFRAVPLRFHCGSIAVPLRFHCGFSAVIKYFALSGMVKENSIRPFGSGFRAVPERLQSGSEAVPERFQSSLNRSTESM